MWNCALIFECVVGHCVYFLQKFLETLSTSRLYIYSYLQNSLYTNRSLLFSLRLSLSSLDVDLMAALQHTFKGGA